MVTAIVRIKVDAEEMSEEELYICGFRGAGLGLYNTWDQKQNTEPAT
jgi:hypothetical protein